MQRKSEVKDTDQLMLPFYDGLFEAMCSYENLIIAFKEVKKNKGAPGIDGITVAEFEKNKRKELLRLQQEVENWKYKPSPVKRVEIPKPNGGVRLLGIPTIRDRVLQASIKLILEPIFDPKFSVHSYGFRPGRNQEQAVKAARDIVKNGKEYVVDMDLSKFFDRIHHDRLIYRLGSEIKDKRILRLIGIILRSGIIDNDRYIPSEEGSVQGSPLSPLLSNIVLDELDKELERRELEFCRFADDCNIFVKSEKAANRVKESITRFVEKKLKLKVNQEKTQAALAKYVKFLGMTILGAFIAISSKSMNKAMDKVKELTPRGTHVTLKESIEQINKWYRGWANYHKMTSYPIQLHMIEAHIRRRLRAQLVRNQKRRRYLVKLFIKRGVPENIAKWTVYTNRKVWALSRTNAAHIAFSNKWFITEQNQHVISGNKLPHWKGIKTKPVLS